MPGNRRKVQKPKADSVELHKCLHFDKSGKKPIGYVIIAIPKGKTFNPPIIIQRTEDVLFETVKKVEDILEEKVPNTPDQID